MPNEVISSIALAQLDMMLPGISMERRFMRNTGETVAVFWHGEDPKNLAVILVYFFYDFL